MLTGTFALNTLLTALLYVGVTTGEIRMTTSFLHHPMDGNWGMAITTSGIFLLAASLVISIFYIRRGTIHKYKDSLPFPSGEKLGGVPLRLIQRVATLALVGCWRPEVWINPV